MPRWATNWNLVWPTFKSGIHFGLSWRCSVYGGVGSHPLIRTSVRNWRRRWRCRSICWRSCCWCFLSFAAYSVLLVLAASGSEPVFKLFVTILKIINLEYLTQRPRIKFYENSFVASYSLGFTWNRHFRMRLMPVLLQLSLPIPLGNFCVLSWFLAWRGSCCTCTRSALTLNVMKVSNDALARY